MKLEDVEAIARDVLITTKHHSPQLIVEMPNGKIQTLLLRFDDETKETTIKMIGIMIRKANIKRYIIVMEGWGVIKEPGEEIITRPSHDPKKREVLAIMEFRADMTENVISIYFHRENGKIVFDERDQSIVKAVSPWNFYKEYDDDAIARWNNASGV